MKINKIEKKDGTFVYRTNVYLGVDSLTGKQVRTTATGRTRKMCEMKANQAINNFIKNGSTVARQKVDFDNFKSLAESWFDNYKLTVKLHSIRATQNFLKVYILPALGSYKLNKISSIMLQEIVNVWAKNANTAKIINGKREKGKCKDYKLILNTIKRIFDYALQLGIVDTNPATKVIPPKLKNRTVKTIKYFDNNELKRFLNYLNTLELTVNNQLNVTLYNFLLATGLRVGEALALNWSHIDFINNTVRVSKTLLQNGTLQNTPKTRESNRLISLDTHTLSLLKKLKLRQSKDILSLVDVKVFSCFGISYSYTNEKLILKKHFKNADVPDIGFHGFRHTHASLLMNNDVNPKEIQARLGHADYSITMNTYSHLSENKEKDTAEKFGEILKAL